MEKPCTDSHIKVISLPYCLPQICSFPQPTLTRLPINLRPRRHQTIVSQRLQRPAFALTHRIQPVGQITRNLVLRTGLTQDVASTCLTLLIQRVDHSLHHLPYRHLYAFAEAAPITINRLAQLLVMDRTTLTRNYELLPLDVRSETSVQTCLQTILKRTGRIDLLVNNAGFAQGGALEKGQMIYYRNNLREEEQNN